MHPDYRALALVAVAGIVWEQIGSRLAKRVRRLGWLVVCLDLIYYLALGLFFAIRVIGTPLPGAASEGVFVGLLTFGAFSLRKRVEAGRTTHKERESRDDGGVTNDPA